MAVSDATPADIVRIANAPFDRSNRLGRWLSIVLYITVTYKTAFLILCIASAATYHQTRQYAATTIVVLVLYLCALPVAVLASSSFDLYKYRRRSLRPLQVILSSLFSAFMCAIMMGLWFSCMYRSYTYSCPVRDGWYGWQSAGSVEALPNLYYLLPWLLIPVMVWDVIYLGLGALAIDRQRHSLPSGHVEKLHTSSSSEHEHHDTFELAGLGHEHDKSISESPPANSHPPSIAPSKPPSTIMSSVPPAYDETRSLASTMMFRDSRSYHICRHCGTVDEE